MTAAIITSLVTLLGMLGGAVAWWVRRRDAKADPLPRHAAEVALSKEALGIVQASAAALEADVQRLREDREADRRDRESDRRRIEVLETNVNSLRQTWMTWYSDLRSRWEHHREQSAPPEPPTIDT